MKEFVQTAGIRPWHGDELVALQNEPMESIQRLLKPMGPMILDGVIGSGAGPYAFTGGLVAMKYPGDDYKIARFAGASLVAAPGTGIIYLQKTTTQKLYDDGNNHNAMVEYTATFIAQSDPGYATIDASLASDEKLFISANPILPYRQDFAVGMKSLGMGPWVTVTNPILNTANQQISARSIQYRINRFTGQVHLRGSVTVKVVNPNTFGTLAQWKMFVNLGMNVFFYPDVEQYFTGTIRTDTIGNTYHQDLGQVDFLKTFGFSIDTSGNMYIGLVRPYTNLAPDNYTVYFNSSYFYVFA